MSDLQSRIAALSPEQRARFEARVAGLTAEIPAVRPEGIPPRDRQKPTPLSYAQQREWAVERFRPSNNVAAALRLEGQVDLGLLARVLTEVVARHEVLRSTVEMTPTGPVQVVQPVSPVPIPVEDLSDLAPAEQEAEVRRRCDAEVIRTFPPAQVHRLRTTALRLRDDAYIVLVTLDHAAADAWSMLIVLREVTALFPVLGAGGDGKVLPALTIQYGDFAVWERAWLDEDRMAAELAHWKRTLADIPPRLALPTDRPAAVRRTFAGDHLAVVMPREPTAALQRFAEREGVSVSMVMLAACAVVLHRYTQQDDLVFGSAVGGRVRPETEQLIGCFANALPLRMRLRRGQTLREVLNEARDVVSTAFDHQEVPFDRLIEELAPQDTAQTPLIQMMINVLAAPATGLSPGRALELPGLRVSLVEVDPGPITIDLIMVVQAGPESLHFDWHYSTELFDRATVERLAAQIPYVLEQLVGRPELRIGEVALLDTTAAAPTAQPAATEASGAGFLDVFQRQVARTPQAPAVVCDGVALSFAALNAEANRLAHRLRGLGVGPETAVGVLVDRSPALMVAVLGVLKAGGAFVPMDATFPADRIGFMLADAGAPVLVTTGKLATLAAGAEPAHTVLLDGPDPLSADDHDPELTPAPATPAYIIYTSGSTGQPKGAVIEHRSLIAFARDVADRLELTAGDRFLQFASPSFDVLIEELFPIWLAGGAVVIPPEKMTGAGLDLVKLTERDLISVMELPAAYWHEWVRELDRTGRTLPPSLRLVIVGAERVLPERLASWQRFGVPLEHVYGITETTVSSTFFRLPSDAGPADLTHLPIGTALPSAELQILDPELRPVPAGAVGELYIGGISLARGYLNRPALTAQRFVANPDPARPGERVYRTGDLVRRRADGNLEFLSRVDTQIKIRGFRVEPAEIESAIGRHPQVAQAVVSVQRSAAGDRRLIAHVVAQGGAETNLNDLRRFLTRELPSYMVPAAFVPVAAIPLTANGKVDLDSLPPPGAERPELVEELVEPQSPLERRLADIIAAVIGVTTVGANDDFFELGGDSILAIMVVSRAQEEGIGLSPLDIFERRTVAQLALAATETQAPRIITPRSPQAEPVLSFDQERLWLEDQLVSGAAYNVGWQQRLIGPLDLTVVEASIRAVLIRHETLRSRFPTVDGRPTQVVDDPDDGWRLRVEDLSALNGDGAAIARRLMGEEVTHVFDLARGPLVRCLVVRLNETEHLLSFISHHIVADVVSVGLFVRELATLYQAGGDLGRAGLPELPIQYLDYAVWQRERLAGEELERQVAYWRRHLSGAPRALTMPTIQHTPGPSAGGHHVGAALTPAETAALKELCRRHDVTPFMVVLATLGTVLGRWAGQRDVVVGVSISNRTDAGTESLIGSFINTLPLRVDLNGDPAFAELLDRVREVALGSYAHADAPLDVIMKQLQITRDPRRTPLFQVMLNVVDVPTVAQFGDITIAPVETPPLPPSFDLVLTTNEVRGALTYTLEYDTGRFSAELIETLSRHLGAFLSAAIADPTRGILDYELEPPVTADADADAVAEPAPQHAVDHYARQRYRVAVVDHEGSWSYSWLAGASDRVARRLAELPPAPVLVANQPTAAFVATVLGCLKAGREFTISDTGDALDIDLTGEFEPAPLVTNPGADWAVERFGLGSDDRFAVLSTLPGQLMSALTSALHAGATLVFPERPLTGDPAGLAAWLKAKRITVVYAGPPLLRAIAAQTELTALRYAFVENPGNLLSHDVDTLRGLAAGGRLVATYRTGPDGRPLAAYPVPADWRLETAPLRVPLGAPLAAGALRLRHGAGQSAATGEVAEIWHGADRTGDLGRRWPDGTLEFVGKVSDHDPQNRG